MPLLILGLFIAIPIVEIAVFIEVGGRIGVWNTVAVVIITAMIGTWLLRSQGLKTLESARHSMERQVFPVAELFDGICLLIAGVLLLTPGFVTDAFGFLLFIPPLRAGLRIWIWGFLQRREGTRIWVQGEEFTGGGPASDGTIDGEFHVIDPDAPKEKDGDGKDGDGTPRLPR